MNIVKRGRGRPPGTGLNDHPTLSKVADMLLVNSKMKPTTAMVRVLDKPSASTIRRLQEKWKAKRATYLAEAEARLTEERNRHQRSIEPAVGKQNFEAIRPSSGLALGLAGLQSPAMRALQKALNNPTICAIREAQESPATRNLRELMESPALRHLKEMMNSPTMRATQALMGNPAMQRLQDSLERTHSLSERLKFPKF